MPEWMESLIIVAVMIVGMIAAVPVLYYFFVWVDYWWGGMLAR